MTPMRQLIVSLVGLVVASAGIFGFFYLCFAYFTYQGDGMDWIYPTAGAFAILWFVSAAGLISSIIRILSRPYIRGHREN